MKILKIADVPNNRTGGMSRTMYCTGDELAKAGHEIGYLFQEQLEVSRQGRLRRFIVPIKLPWIIWKLEKQHKTYDLLEIHEPIAAVYCLIRKFKKNWPPAVVFSYGLEERSKQVELNYYKYKGLAVSLKKRLAPYTIVLQAAYAVRNCNQVVVSNSQDAEFLHRAGIPASHITLHHSGVEQYFIEAGRNVVATRTNRKGIIFLGTWLIRKGILDLIPTVDRLLRTHPDLYFTVAGCQAKPEAVLKDFSPDLHSRINVIAQLSSPQEVFEVLSRHSIFVLPSYFEGQPLALIEAASAGLAIVTTATCGMLDFIEDGVNGYAVPVGNVNALTQRLDQLVKDQSLARQLGEAARKTSEHFTWKSSAENLAKTYQKVLSKTEDYDTTQA